jgi:hypothetical protein
MSKFMTWWAGLVLVGVLAGGGQPAAAAVRAAAGSWGLAIGVPGLGVLDKGGYARVESVSCVSAGNCAAGGDYSRHRPGPAAVKRSQGFVVTERDGVWGKAAGVPGLGTLNRGGHAEVLSVSCAPAGSCAAGGFYRDGARHRQGFVVTERHGAWGRAIGVPGLAALNKGAFASGGAQVTAVSCGSAGSCAAGGYYTGWHSRLLGFVAVERNGVWGKAIEVPGLRALDQGSYATVSSVSCASAGNCAAGGTYSRHGWHGFVADERNGRWGAAVQVPGLAALSTGQIAQVNSVSCASPGNCAAAGYYTDSGGKEQGFVADERNGTWDTAILLPGLAALNKQGLAEVKSVSCASPGNCAAGGDYSNLSHGFVADENNGVWGTAIQLPGLAALNKNKIGGVGAVSCASPGSCAAAGLYLDGSDHFQAFVASQNSGVWGTAIGVPGLAALNKGGDADATSLSCAPAGPCAAGGYYYAGNSGHHQGFVVTQAR